MLISFGTVLSRISCQVLVWMWLFASRSYAATLLEACPPHRPNGLYPHPTDCNAFITCNDGSFHITSCAPNLHFNPEDQVCDWPENVRCSSSGSSDLASASLYDTRQHPGGRVMAKLAEQFASGDSPYRCQQQDGGAFGIVEDCGLFVRCNQGRSFLMTCSGTKQFNPRDGRCIDGPSDNMQCTPKFEFRCLTPRGLFADSSDRNKYYNCWNYRWYHQTCPDELSFNPAKGWCDFPWNIEEFSAANLDPTGHGIQIAELQQPFTNHNTQQMPAPFFQPPATQNLNPLNFDTFRDSPSVQQPIINQPPIHLFINQPQPSFVPNANNQQFTTETQTTEDFVQPPPPKLFTSEPVTGFGLIPDQPSFVDLQEDFARSQFDQSRNHWPATFTPTPSPFAIPATKILAEDLARHRLQFTTQPDGLNFHAEARRVNLTNTDPFGSQQQKPRRLHIEFRTPDAPVRPENAVDLQANNMWLPNSLLPSGLFEDETPFVPVRSSHSIPRREDIFNWHHRLGNSNFAANDVGAGVPNSMAQTGSFNQMTGFIPNQVTTNFGTVIGPISNSNNNNQERPNSSSQLDDLLASVSEQPNTVSFDPPQNHSDHFVGNNVNQFIHIIPNIDTSKFGSKIKQPEFHPVSTTQKPTPKPRPEIKRVGIRRYFNNSKSNPQPASLISRSVNRFLLPGGAL